LHVIGSSRVLNIPRLIVQSGLDGQGFLVEVPDLSSSSVSCLDNHVSVTDEVKVSASSHVRNNVEISFNIKAILFVEFTLNWISLPFISIDNIELLIDLSVFVPDNDVSVFSINTTLNIEDLSFFVLDDSTLVSE
jgi:hypothetical protein